MSDWRGSTPTVQQMGKLAFFTKAAQSALREVGWWQLSPGGKKNCDQRSHPLPILQTWGCTVRPYSACAAKIDTSLHPLQGAPDIYRMSRFLACWRDQPEARSRKSVRMIRAKACQPRHTKSIRTILHDNLQVAKGHELWYSCHKYFQLTIFPTKLSKPFCLGQEQWFPGIMQTYLQHFLHCCLGHLFSRLQNVGGAHETRKGVKSIVYAEVGCLQVWLNESLVHRVYCIRYLHSKSLVSAILGSPTNSGCFLALKSKIYIWTCNILCSWSNQTRHDITAGKCRLTFRWATKLPAGLFPLGPGLSDQYHAELVLPSQNAHHQLCSHANPA